MRFLFDRNISHRILKFIPKQYLQSTTVKKEGLIKATDREIWEFAYKMIISLVTIAQDAALRLKKTKVRRD